MDGLEASQGALCRIDPPFVRKILQVRSALLSVNPMASPVRFWRSIEIPPGDAATATPVTHRAVHPPVRF